MNGTLLLVGVFSMALDSKLHCMGAEWEKNGEYFEILRRECGKKLKIQYKKGVEQLEIGSREKKWEQLEMG